MFHLTWQKSVAFLLGFAVVFLTGAYPQDTPAADIRRLMEQLDTPNAETNVFGKIVKLARKDPAAREYLVQKLPEMIRGPSSDLWLDALRLAGTLKVKEAIPALQEVMSRPPFPAQNWLSFGRIWYLDGDIVAKTLSQIGEPAIPAAVALLKSQDPFLRGRALLVLRNIATPAARRALADQLPHETDRENREIIQDALSHEAHQAG